MRRTIILAAAVTLAAACGSNSTDADGLAAAATGGTQLEDAATECYLTAGGGGSISDDGRSLTITGKGEAERTGASLRKITCVLAELDVPDAVVSRMDRTRALDGAQEAEWDGLRAWWTYHPDEGLEIIVETA
jgi:hypothetical protein